MVAGGLVEAGNVEVMLELVVVLVGELDVFADFGGLLTGAEVTGLERLVVFLELMRIFNRKNQIFQKI